MPIYTYRCKICNRTEAIKSTITERNDLKVCQPDEKEMEGGHLCPGVMERVDEVEKEQGRMVANWMGVKQVWP